MLQKSSKNNQPNLFYSQLRDMLDSQDPLVALAESIDWEYFNETFNKYYSDQERPAKPIRMMVGLLLSSEIPIINISVEWMNINRLTLVIQPI